LSSAAAPASAFHGRTAVRSSRELQGAERRPSAIQGRAVVGSYRAPSADQVQFKVEQLSGVIGRRAPTARNRVARGERVARCPWIPYKQNLRPGGPTENVRRAFLSPHPGLGRFSLRIQGRRAPLRFALAPGYLIPRLRRSAPCNSRRRSMPRYSAPAALGALQFPSTLDATLFRACGA
jgi:hypothetical protein